MAKMKDAAKSFNIFEDTTPPRSAAADPARSVPAATFQPPAGSATLPPVPAPYVADGDSPALTGKERADLATCEAAVDRLRLAFAAAGKALQVIRDAHLYRETHDTFEAYLAERWEMSRPQAYRLIDAWPLAERLSPMGDTLNERQIRELLPLADRHGQDAAVTVYQTIAEAEDVKVTAAVLRDAVAVLPADRFDADEAVEQIRAFLAGELQPAAPAADPGEQMQQVRARLRRLIRPDVVRAAGPAAAKELAAELRALAERLEAGE